MDILFSKAAVDVLDRVYTEKSIFNRYQHFTDWFVKWNYIFHQYVRENMLSKVQSPKGIFNIGSIGYLYYEIVGIKEIKCIVVNDFVFPKFKFTSSYVPKVNTSKSPSSTYATAIT